MEVSDRERHRVRAWSHVRMRDALTVPAPPSPKVHETMIGRAKVVGERGRNEGDRFIRRARASSVTAQPSASSYVMKTFWPAVIGGYNY